MTGGAPGERQSRGREVAARAAPMSACDEEGGRTGGRQQARAAEQAQIGVGAGLGERVLRCGDRGIRRGAGGCRCDGGWGRTGRACCPGRGPVRVRPRTRIGSGRGRGRGRGRGTRVGIGIAAGTGVRDVERGQDVVLSGVRRAPGGDLARVDGIAPRVLEGEVRDEVVDGDPRAARLPEGQRRGGARGLDVEGSSCRDSRPLRGPARSPGAPPPGPSRSPVCPPCPRRPSHRCRPAPSRRPRVPEPPR